MSRENIERMSILAAILIGMGGSYFAGSLRGRELERAEIGPVVEIGDGSAHPRVRGIDGVWRPWVYPDPVMTTGVLPKTLPPHNCGEP